MANVSVLASAMVSDIDFSRAPHLLRGLRRADAFVQLAVLAGHTALEQSGIMAHCQPADVGVYVGSTTGPLPTNFDFLDTLFDDGEGQASPTIFSHSVHNAAAGYVSRLLNLQGMSQTITLNGWPFVAALLEAKSALASGALSHALVLGVEESCSVIDEAAGRLAGGSERPPQRGAVAWLLTAGDEAGVVLGEIDLDEVYNKEAHLLQRDEEIFTATVALPLYPPGALGHCFSLTTALQSMAAGSGQGSWQVEAPFGRARCAFGRGARQK